MDAETRQQLEARLRALHAAGDLAATATLALTDYGPEVLGFLIALHRDEDAAGEVFARLGEDLWRGLPDFRWGSSFRTWVYVLARHASARYRRDPRQRRGRGLYSDEISRIVQEVRSATQPWLQTEVKDRVTRLREQLDPDDQALLVLRVDRDMAWSDIARVLAEETGGAELDDDEALRRRAAALRKRFERVKVRLRELAIEAGLLATPSR